ncbi:MULTISPECIES: cell division regulator GpsB [Priestia]|jgi:DivIVA domain-containing protein|uniref:cell division regulator GpsB n=1 Tax=Priestia TaxID=2800373 RepID=UPI00203EF8C6|nr:MULTISPECIES: cell division regulator GpsB [Priestia]MCM3772069.1 cell division regulator GpsB [Priestia aryabhattai]MDY0940350.1 cell division regulator GpsB [Priestia megaterium]
MLADKIRLTAKEILEKEFKTGMRGYNQEEVDKYLDSIIKDYEAFHEEIEVLQTENLRLKKQVEELSKKPQQPSFTPPPAQQQQQAGTTNFDILKRLSNLEKHVFGSKLYE